jgi:hypothetical protein
MCLGMYVSPCSLVEIYVRLSENLVHLCRALRRHIKSDCSLQTREQFFRSLCGPLVPLDVLFAR